MHVPTIYNTDIDESYDELVLSDDKLHHLINVLRIRNNSPIKISNGKGILFFGKLKDKNIQISSKKEYKRDKTINIFVPPIQDKTRFRFMIEKLGENLYNTVNGKYDMKSVCVDRKNLYLQLLKEKKENLVELVN